MKRNLLLLLCLLGFGAAFAADDDIPEFTKLSDAVRVDARMSVGGRIIHGTQRISPVAGNENANARLTVDGSSVQGWTVGNPQYDSTVKRDGWHAFSLNEGKTAAEANLLVLNDDDVEIHGGELKGSGTTTWDDKKIHVVRNWVRIPEGRTLTIKENAIVKFCENTGIQVDGTIKANNAVFTSIADDTAGGDTDMNGETADVGYGLYDITGSGVKTLTNCDIRCAASLPENTTWASGKVVHVMGVLRVPSGVTLKIQSGTVVKFATGAELKADGGSIQASGAIFTHIADDSEEAGGDTNGDGDATSPVHDAYKLTGFTPSTDCELRYITLTFPGGTINGTTTLVGNRIHKVTGNITIASGGKLIVQPGAIVKMGEGLSITVNTNATLEAIGNCAQPIVFTSDKDGRYNGGANTAQAGDWGQICNSGGTVNLSYAQIYYCGVGSSMNDAIYMGSGSCSLDNCIIAHVKQYVAGLDGGSWTMRNSVFYDFDTAFRHFGSNSNINCVFYDFKYLTNNGSMNFTNCVISNYNTALCWLIDTSSYKNCVIWNPSNIGPQSSNEAGFNGNIWADPLFTDPAKGDFTLKAGSPCIDAGDGTVAPEFDYWGRPRMDVVKVADSGKPNADGVCPDIGIYEMSGSYTGVCANLTVSSVTAPATARSGQEVSVSWTITNEGNSEAVGPWRDLVSLQGDEALGGQIVPLGEAVVEGTIAPLASLEVTQRFTLPPLKAGNWKIGVTTNAYRDVYEVKRADNQTFSEAATAVTLPVWSSTNNKFTVGGYGETGFALTKSNSARIVTITPPSGAKMSAYGADGYLPSGGNADVKGVTLANGTVKLVVPAGAEAPYVTLANEGGAPATATVSVATATLSLLEAAPASILNRGTSTMRIIGTGLSANSVFKLTLGSTTVTGQTLSLEDGLVAAVQFNVNNIAVGSYTLSVTENGSTKSLSSKITVKSNGVGPKLEAWLETPPSVRDGRIYTAWLCYKNSGDADMTMPIFRVSCNSSTQISYTVDGEYASRPLRYAGISPTAPAGVLKAGEENRVPVFFTLKGSYKLGFKTISQNETEHSTFGTWAEYAQAMAQAATRLNARGREEYRLSEMTLHLERCNRDSYVAFCGVLKNRITEAPLDNVELYVRKADDSEMVEAVSDITDANGCFILDGLEGATEYVLMTNSTECAVDSRFTTITNGDMLGNTIYANVVRQLRIWVNGNNGMPAEGVGVNVIFENGGALVGVTDGEGCCTLSIGDLSGNAVVHVTPENESKTIAKIQVSPQIILNDAEIELDRTSEMRVEVRDSNGTGVPYALVRVMLENGTGMNISVGENGQWQGKIAVGSHRAFACLDGYEVSSVHDFKVVADSANHLSIEMKKLSGTLRGTVSSKSGELDSPRVELKDLQGGMITAHCNDNGTYSISCEVGKEYMVRAVDYMNQATNWQKITVADTVEMNFNMENPARISGRVNVDDQAAFENGAMYFMDPISKLSFFVNLSETGTYERYLPVGKYYLVIDFAGYMKQLHYMEITGGCIADFELQHGASVSGTLSKMSGDYGQMYFCYENGQALHNYLFDTGGWKKEGLYGGTADIFLVNGNEIAYARSNLVENKNIGLSFGQGRSLTVTLNGVLSSNAVCAIVQLKRYPQVQCCIPVNNLKINCVIPSGFEAYIQILDEDGNCMAIGESSGNGNVTIAIEKTETIQGKLYIDQYPASGVQYATFGGSVQDGRAAISEIDGSVSFVFDNNSDKIWIAKDGIGGFESTRAELISRGGELSFPELKNANSLKYQIVTKNGMPVSGATVEISDNQGRYVRGETDCEGRIRLLALPSASDETYYVSVSVDNYILCKKVLSSLNTSSQYQILNCGMEELVPARTRWSWDTDIMGRYFGELITVRNKWREQFAETYDVNKYWKEPPPDYKSCQLRSCGYNKNLYKEFLQVRQYVMNELELLIEQCDKIDEVNIEIRYQASKVCLNLLPGLLGTGVAGANLAASVLDKGAMGYISLDSIELPLVLFQLEKNIGYANEIMSAQRSLGIYYQTSGYGSNWARQNALVGNIDTIKNSRLNFNTHVSNGVKILGLLGIWEDYNDLNRLSEQLVREINGLSYFQDQAGKYMERLIQLYYTPYHKCPDDDDPPPEEEPTDNDTGNPVQSCDPNEISGMVGLGDAGTQRFVKPGDWLDYTVYFENKSTAAAPAQEVWVTHNLSKWLDWSTLELGEIGFNNQIQLELKGKARGTATVPQEGTNYHVRMNAAMDEATGEFTLYLRSYDKTRQAYGYWPESVYAGFLPPNDSTHRGEGHVTFRVKVKDNAPEGAFINAEATIVFDANDPITTSPAWFNWVTTAENPVADATTLRWDTSDDAAGTTYVVNYWSGDPDPTAPGTTVTFNSDTLTTGSWRIADGLAVGTWYWNVTKTNGDHSSKTSTWSFEILATHTLAVNGGIGGGMYRTNTRVTAEANTVEGKIFTGWTAVGLDMSVEELSEKRLVFYMPDHDVTLTANYKGDTETQTLELLKGWNWVGFSVLPEDRKISSVLGVNGFSVNDMVVDEEDSTTFNGTNWIPSNFTMDYGRMYNIYVSKRSTVEVTGLPGEAKPVTVYKGWNWLANPADRAVSPAELIHSAGFQANDCIQGEEDSVTFNGQKWIPSTGFLLEPGKGYKIYTQKAGTLSFGEGK